MSYAYTILILLVCERDPEDHTLPREQHQHDHMWQCHAADAHPGVPRSRFSSRQGGTSGESHVRGGGARETSSAACSSPRHPGLEMTLDAERGTANGSATASCPAEGASCARPRRFRYCRAARAAPSADRAASCSGGCARPPASCACTCRGRIGHP